MTDGQIKTFVQVFRVMVEVTLNLGVFLNRIRLWVGTSYAKAVQHTATGATIIFAGGETSIFKTKQTEQLLRSSSKKKVSGI